MMLPSLVVRRCLDIDHHLYCRTLPNPLLPYTQFFLGRGKEFMGSTELASVAAVELEWVEMTRLLEL